MTMTITPPAAAPHHPLMLIIVTVPSSMLINEGALPPCPVWEDFYVDQPLELRNRSNPEVVTVEIVEEKAKAGVAAAAVAGAVSLED